MQRLLLIHSDIVDTPCPHCGTKTEAIVERSDFAPHEYYEVDFRWNCECSEKSLLKWEKADATISTLTELGKQDLFSKERKKGKAFLLALHGYLWYRKHLYSRYLDARYNVRLFFEARRRDKAERMMEKRRKEWSDRWGGRDD